MRRSVSPIALIGAMLRKDLRLYSRDKIYLFLSLLALVAFVVVFRLSPATVDETITIAVSPGIETMVADARRTLTERGVSPQQLAGLDELDLSEEEGLSLVELDSAEQTRRVIEGELEVYRQKDGTLVLRDTAAGEPKPKNARRVGLDIGIAFPEAFIADVAMGNRPTVTVFTDAAVPEEIQGAMRSFVREIAFEIAGEQLPFSLPDEDMIILGQDRAGDQPSLREKMRPMLVFLVFLMETLSMAALISTEVARRTVTALLVTPMTLTNFLTAKTIFGVGLALSQGLIVLALVGSFAVGNPSLLLVIALIGAIMFTGVAMLIGAAGKDFMSQLMYGMLFTIPLMIPAFSVLLPGSTAAWVRMIPSYPVIDLLVGVTIYGAGWADAFGRLAYALLWVAVIFGAGLAVLKRKVASL